MDADVYPRDIFTEPDADVDTLSNLGPLTGMAGIWESAEGVDEHPVATGTEVQAYVERYELQPIDPQTNGPQLFYGLRYHRHIVKPGEVETFHDQVGYWLWEPATGNVILSLSLPRGQTAMATGTAASEDRRFGLEAMRGSLTQGIVSNPFLERAFRTTAVQVLVTIGEGTWSYDETTTLEVEGVAEPFAHRDRNTLRRVAPPTPNRNFPSSSSSPSTNGGCPLHFAADAVIMQLCPRSRSGTSPKKHATNWQREQRAQVSLCRSSCAPS